MFLESCFPFVSFLPTYSIIIYLLSFQTILPVFPSHLYFRICSFFFPFLLFPALPSTLFLPSVQHFIYYFSSILPSWISLQTCLIVLHSWFFLFLCLNVSEFENVSCERERTWEIQNKNKISWAKIMRNRIRNRIRSNSRIINKTTIWNHRTARCNHRTAFGFIWKPYEIIGHHMKS